MRNILIIALLIALSACGGGGSDTPSDILPSVAGTYECMAGCSGVCDIDPTLLVTQDGDRISSTDSTGTVMGSINSDGEFTASNADCSCEGQIVDTISTVVCTCRGITCQEVTYQRQ